MERKGSTHDVPCGTSLCHREYVAPMFHVEHWAVGETSYESFPPFLEWPAHFRQDALTRITPFHATHTGTKSKPGKRLPQFRLSNAQALPFALLAPVWVVFEAADEKNYCCRKPKRWSRQDNDSHQPFRRICPGRRFLHVDRLRSAGQLDRRIGF